MSDAITDETDTETEEAAAEELDKDLWTVFTHDEMKALRRESYQCGQTQSWAPGSTRSGWESELDAMIEAAVLVDRWGSRVDGHYYDDEASSERWAIPNELIQEAEAERFRLAEVVMVGLSTDFDPACPEFTNDEERDGFTLRGGEFIRWATCRSYSDECGGTQSTAPVVVAGLDASDLEDFFNAVDNADDDDLVDESLRAALELAVSIIGRIRPGLWSESTVF